MLHRIFSLKQNTYGTYILYLEIFFISFQHAVEPGQQLLGTVIGVEDDRNVVVLGHQPHVLGPGNGAENGGLLLGVLDALAGEEGGAAVGELDDDGRVDGAGRLQHRVYRRGGGAVEGWGEKKNMC